MLQELRIYIHTRFEYKMSMDVKKAEEYHTKQSVILRLTIVGWFISLGNCTN